MGALKQFCSPGDDFPFPFPYDDVPWPLSWRPSSAPSAAPTFLTSSEFELAESTSRGPTPSLPFTFYPTEEPTEFTPVDGAPASYIPDDIQIVSMILGMAILGVFVAFACCMTKPSCCWHAWLNSWCQCSCFNCCFKCCCCCCGESKSKKDEQENETPDPTATSRGAMVGSLEPDWVLANFGWVRPLGPEGSEMVTFQKQLGLLLWKSFLEKSRQRKSIALYFGIPLLILFVCLLLYGTFNDWNSSGVIELFLVPFSFVVVLQLPTVSIVSEKSLRLKESLRMMGMRETPYWCAYFIADGIIMGGALSLLLALEGLFMSLFWNLGASNHDDGSLAPFAAFMGFWWFLWTYCLALTALGFFISTVVDTPQTAGQVAFFTLIAGVVTFLVFIFSPTLLEDLLGTPTKQAWWCLFPPMALQVGLYSNSYIACQLHRQGSEFIALSSVSGLLVLDVFLFLFLAWYLGQVLPSEYGIQKPPWFLFQPSYWLGHDDQLQPGERRKSSAAASSPLTKGLMASSEGHDCATEEVDRDALGEPSVEVRNLRKTFNAFSSNPFKAVDDLSFDLYENQIFSLLGHNGAGKTTTINMLTGLFPSDRTSGDTRVYGSAIASEMAEARRHLGVCPQHDVLFENLTAREHIVFFFLMKGAGTWSEAGVEADALLSQFHLHERAHYVGSELSGGMKRKLSVSVALCGGSKFVVLDEPTAGMDPLARRDLWDLLKECRHGRTMLLTTHYMDEADVLGDRIAIMSRGQLQCIGSSTFLKRTFGAGYKVVATMKPQAIDKSVAAASTFPAEKGGPLVNSGAAAAAQEYEGSGGGGGEATTSLETHPVTQGMLDFVRKHVPGAFLNLKECTANSFVLVLPFDQTQRFADFFEEFDSKFDGLGAEGYGVTITDLEEVFLKVGEDHTLRASRASSSSSRDQKPFGGEDDSDLVEAQGRVLLGAGEAGGGRKNFQGQVLGLLAKRLMTAVNDLKTLPLIGFPIAATVAAFACNVTGQFGTTGSFNSNIATAAILLGAYIPFPGLIAEQVVEERVSKLRNVLTVMGCDVNAYWLGTFLGDFSLFFVTVVALWITVPACIGAQDDDGSDDDDEGLDQWLWSGALFFFVPLFGCHICSFSYAASFAFPSPRLALVFMPLFCIVLIFVPAVLISSFELGFGDQGIGAVNLSQKSQAGVILWGVALLSPHGAFGMGLVTISTKNLTAQVDSYPPFYAICLIMAVESALYFFAALQVDASSLALVLEQHHKESEREVRRLDPDVQEERTAVEGMPSEEVEGAAFALRIAGLRKVYPAKSADAPPLQAVKHLSVRVGKGELFGLLGANGAGKTTAISMVMRAAFPTAGNVHVMGRSVLSDFTSAATCLGVVTQTNTLWDRLSCVDHLRMFARVRGVPAGRVEALVAHTIQDMELAPYAHKLAMQLSGGMKRKLCVAIALIGDPDVVLLDEPSAGLDPVSRRNLWNVIIKTMASRAVVLTTHSMEEAEALCTRIGIMVKGQLRVIGTPQHLKQKFGSGYEVSVKLDKGDDFEQRSKDLSSFMAELCPRGDLLSDNGGLLTYRVPQDDMRVGMAFDALEKGRERFRISDYAIAQPTLEQVFVRTVVENSEAERPSAQLQRHQKQQSGEEATGYRVLSIADEEGGEGPFEESAASLDQGFEQEEVSSGGLRSECCGLNRRSHRFMAGAAGVFAFLLFMTMTGLLGPPKYDYKDCHREPGMQPCAVPAFYFNAVVFVFALAVAITGCCGCCFCIPPNPEEDD